MKKFLSLVCFFGALSALPTSPLVQTGDVNIQNEKLRIEITTSDFAEIDWQNFSISQNELVRFIQPSEQALAINRVISSQPSVLMGNLEANGQIMLINQNGVFVGKDAYLDVGSWIASTLDLVDKDNFHFAGESTASIINDGTICSKTGDVILISQNVENAGDIKAKQGAILFGAGKDIYYQPNQKNRLFVRLSDEQIYEGKGIDNSGTLSALHTELVADGNLYEYAIHHSGNIDALGVKEVNGEIFLVAEEGLNQVHGSLTASGENGGRIHILGKRVALDGEITVDASGEAAGGEILIGGDYKGSNPEFINSEYTYVGEDVAIRANAKGCGKGGKVIVWGDDISAMYGLINAKGGNQSGDGGFVEISSLGNLYPKGLVDTSAPFGKNGTLLLDPCAVTISGAATTGGVTNSTPPPQPLSYSFGVLAAANILDTEITGFLAANDVTIDASASGSGGAGTGSITVSTGLSWASGNKLTLISDSTISIQELISSTMAGLADTTVVLDLQAPVIVIGTAGFAGDDLGMNAVSGALSANFSTSMTLYGSDNSGGGANFINNAGGIINISGKLGASTGGDLTLLAASGVAGSALIQGNATVDLGDGDLLIQAQDGESLFSNSVAATVEVTANNVTILGGSGAAPSNAGFFMNSGGDVDITLTGDLIGTGGTSAVNGLAYISTSGGVGDITISAVNITFTGGTGGATSENQAGIFHDGIGVSNSTITASEVLTLTGGGAGGPATITKKDILANLTVNARELNITSGSASSAGADIECNGNFAVNVTENLNMTSIAAGGPATISMQGASKQLNLNVGGDITANGNGPACAFSFPAASSTVNISCTNFTFNCALTSTEASGLDLQDGILNFNVAGSCILDGTASGAAPSLGIQGATTSGSVAELNLVASSFFIAGGATFFGVSGVTLGTLGGGGGTGVINLTATGPGGITMTGGSGNSAFALLGAFGTEATNAINIQATHPDGNITLNGSTTGGITNAGVTIQNNSGAITDPTGGNIICNGTPEGPILITVGASPSANILLQTGVNIELVYTTIENLSAGCVTLVVDNNFPTSPSVGTGAFIMDANSAITTTTGEIKIFTAEQSLNSILGTLNGCLFVPGTIYIDSATEQWNTYYSSSSSLCLNSFSLKRSLNSICHTLNKDPFTSKTVFKNSGRGRHSFNSYLGWPRPFVASYEVLEDESLRSNDQIEL